MAKFRKLGRESAHRKMMLRNLTTQLLKHKRITTTLPKAKETKRMVDKMITLGKKGDLSSRRRALSYITEKEVVDELFSEIAGKYVDRNGGYSRILKMENRRGDGAPMVIIELV